MDANEAHARARMVEAISRSATGAATCPEDAAVIREAQANLQREQQNYFVPEAEHLQRLHLLTLDQLDRMLPYFQRLGYPPIQRAVIVGNRHIGIPEKATCHVGRHDWDRWFATFDMIASQLGYARKETPTPDRRAARAPG